MFALTESMNYYLCANAVDMLSDQSVQLSSQIDITKQLSNQISLLQQSIISLEKALLKKDAHK